MSRLYIHPNGRYYLDARKDGRRRIFSLKTRSVREAKQLKEKFDADLFAGRIGLAPTRLTLREAAEEFLSVRCKGLAPTTLKRHRERLLGLCGWLPGAKLVHINQEDLRRYRNMRGERVASGTLKGDLITLGTFFRWCVEEKRYLPVSPLSQSIKKVSGVQRRPRYALNPEEREIYLQALTCEPRARMALLLGIHAGLRRGELLHLEGRDIRDGVIHLENKPHLDGWTIKNYHFRKIPVEPELAPAVENLPEGLLIPSPTGGLWDQHRFTMWWLGLVGRKELPPRRENAARVVRHGVNLHELRHTYASIQISEKRTEIYTLMRRMGHSSIETTKGYFHLFNP